MSLMQTSDVQASEKVVNEVTYLCKGDPQQGSVVDQNIVMGTIITKPGTQESTNDAPNTIEAVSPTFYGVHLPHEHQDPNYIPFEAFVDKLDALRAAKKNPSARFKAFKSREEAEEFALNGIADNISTSICETSSVTINKENPNCYKTPKPQDNVRIRKSMEKGDLHTVETMVWENPRYLINCGETPTILQEGTRYNALHIAAKSKNAALADLIIRTVSDMKFIKLFDGDVDDSSCKSRSQILLDLYLNTPEKALNETPLHFAAKFGAVEVVEVLLSCTQCDKTVRNKSGETPKDVILSRFPGTEALRARITALFEGQFYVPVLRSEDNSSQPTIGLPFSPTALPSLTDSDPLAVRCEIRAFAGPMDATTASAFRRRWKTPPREPVSSQPGSPHSGLRRTDPDKGLEIDGRKLAVEAGVDWKEYWSFLDTFVNLSSVEGLHKLEAFLEKRFHCLDNLEPSPSPQKPAEPLSSGVGDTSVLSPMSELCITLQACTLQDNSRKTQLRKEREVRILPAQRTSHKHEEDLLLLNMLANPGLSPILYVEKSCQVFARRIAAGLLQLAIGGVIGDSVEEMLSQEVRKLRDLVDSFMSDPRFISVDFHLVHSRIVSIVLGQLSSATVDEWEMITSLCAAIGNKQTPSSPVLDDLEQECSYRMPASPGRALRADIVPAHVRCVAAQIGAGTRGPDALGSAAAHRTEADCVAVWSDAHKCCCHWVTARGLSRNGRKQASFKRGKFGATGRKILSLDDVAKRLAFSDEPDDPTPVIDSSSEDEDIFFTPPDSPIRSDSDDAMSSAEEDQDVFLEGDCPTRTDMDVLLALDGVQISPADFPLVCRWRHMMNLMVKGRRQDVGLGRQFGSPAAARTPKRAPPLKMPSTEGWHRVLPPSSPASPQFRRWPGYEHNVPWSK